jgi:hypothetical protein
MDNPDLFCFACVLVGLTLGLAGWLSIRRQCRQLPFEPLDGSGR